MRDTEMLKAKKIVLKMSKSSVCLAVSLFNSHICISLAYFQSFRAVFIRKTNNISAYTYINTQEWLDAADMTDDFKGLSHETTKQQDGCSQAHSALAGIDMKECNLFPEWSLITKQNGMQIYFTFPGQGYSQAFLPLSF